MGWGGMRLSKGGVQCGGVGWGCSRPLCIPQLALLPPKLLDIDRHDDRQSASQAVAVEKSADGYVTSPTHIAEIMCI